MLLYLDDHCKEQVTTRGIDGLDLQSYLASMPLSGRPNWRRGNEKPGTDFEMLQRQALDVFGSTIAIILMSETSRSIEVARRNLMDDFTRWRRDFQTCGTSTYCGGAAILTVTLLRSVKLSSIPFSENSRPIPLCFRPP